MAVRGRRKAKQVLVLVSDIPGGCASLRIRALFERVSSENVAARILYRDRGNYKALALYLKALAAMRPDLVYLNNIGWVGAVVALFAKRGLGVPIVVDSGDVVAGNFSNAGKSALSCKAADRVERLMITMADEVVVRGRWHAEYLRGRGIRRAYHWIPEGVDLSLFKPVDSEGTKSAMGFTGKFVVGTVGQLAWNGVHQMAYGWDIIEALAMIPDEKVAGLIVGDGDGLAHLKRLAEARKVSDRVYFAGWIPHDTVPLYINAMDVCVSTQSNDPVGWARTTGKLPEFMACGRFILATEVGEAARLLKGTGQLMPYQGLRDPEHPVRLAGRLVALKANPEYLMVGRRNREIAERLFDYNLLARKVTEVLSRAFHEKDSFREMLGKKYT